MITSNIDSFTAYFEIVNKLDYTKNKIILFRGQSDKKPLIPSICRNDANFDTTKIEIQMLNELKRRTQLTIKATFKTDWEWLVFAQHWGMKTRLLDWTSNPLTALWFACKNERKYDDDSYVYILSVDDSYLINTKSESESPFKTSKTRVLLPALNNERIIAQAGWFTAHKYSNTWKRFVDLKKNIDIKEKIEQIRIPSKSKKEILEKLSIFGINSQSLFPDIIGICNHLNWMYSK